MATGKETDEVIGQQGSTSTSTTKGEAIALPDAVLFSRSDGASVRARDTCMSDVRKVREECEISRSMPLPPLKSGGSEQCKQCEPTTLTKLKSKVGRNANKSTEEATELTNISHSQEHTNLPNFDLFYDMKGSTSVVTVPNLMVCEKLRVKVTRCPADKQTDDVNYSFSSAAFPLLSGCFSSVPVSSDNDYCTPDTSSNAPCTDHGTSPQISRPEKEAAILSLTPTDNLATSPTNSIAFHDESYGGGTQGGESRRKPQKRHLPEKLEPDLPSAKKQNLEPFLALNNPAADVDNASEWPELTITDDDFL